MKIKYKLKKSQSQTKYPEQVNYSLDISDEKQLGQRTVAEENSDNFIVLASF
jgi:hypothetical protein